MVCVCGSEVELEVAPALDCNVVGKGDKDIDAAVLVEGSVAVTSCADRLVTRSNAKSDGSQTGLEHLLIPILASAPNRSSIAVCCEVREFHTQCASL